ncbi:MAG: hypothetical protein NC133_02560 [Prevotella sp.]|nr:hypothetical protein [Prevotella sp.]
MDKLDFAELHKTKLDVIFEHINILANIKESDTQLPPKFFHEITDTVILDYQSRIGVLNKNTKFVTRELLKDFRVLRRKQKRLYALARKQRSRERVVYVLPREVWQR